MSCADHALLTLTIDLTAVVGNWRTINNRLNGTAAAAVVKADAYGLGAAQVVPALAQAGCTCFFVATLDEGVAVRGMVPRGEIFVLSGPVAASEEVFDAHGLIPVLNSVEQLARWRDFSRSSGRKLAAALHIDTGMTRLGLDLSEVKLLAERPDGLAGIDPVLGMSHLACADEADHPLNAQQLAAFTQAKTMLDIPRWSLAASSGIYLGRDYHFQLVRPGAALYGINPTPGHPTPLQPVVHLQGRVLQVRDVDSPQTVGYGAAYAVTQKGRIATVAAGYADGYCRALGNRAHGVIGGVKVPVVGRISMDLITVDISALPADRIHAGDMIDLIGPGHDVDQLAAEAGTIGYEILTHLPRRAVRHYIGGTP